MKIFVILAVLCLAQYLRATEVQIKQCSIPDKCTVKDLMIKECESGYDDCALYKNSKYTIEFKYTPEFSAEELKLDTFALLLGSQKVPFLEQGKSACDYTECPLEQGKEGSFLQEVQIPFNSFRNKYDVGWMLIDPATNNFCCVTFKVQILEPEKPEES